VDKLLVYTIHLTEPMFFNNLIILAIDKLPNKEERLLREEETVLMVCGMANYIN